MKRLRWLTSHWFLGIILMALFLGHYFSDEPYIKALRLKTFDLYQRLEPRDPDKAKMMAEPVIVDLDDASLEELGQWPWPRTRVAEMVDRLTELGAAVVGFDIVFAEPDRTSPAIWAETTPGLNDDLKTSLEKLPSNDEILAQSVAKSRIVLGQVGLGNETKLTDLPRKVAFGVKGARPEPWINQYLGVVRNRPELEKVAAGIGLFSTIPDEDGIYRRVALIERVGDEIYPSLSLEMLRVALGGKDDYLIRMNKQLGGIQDIVVKTFQPGQHFIIPTDPKGRVWVHYARYTQKDRIYVPAKDLFYQTEEEKAAVQKKIAGKLVVIGTSAVGLKDIRATPIDGALAGVEVHLQLLQTILANAHLTRPFLATQIEAGTIAIGGVLMILLIPHLGAIWAFLLAASLITAEIAIAWHYYTAERVLVDASYPGLAVFLIFLMLTYLNYMREERERRQIRGAFSHYVSPALLEQLAENPEKLRLGGETRDLTVLFCDIRGFTTISEQFDAEGLTRFINQFLTPMTNVILDHKGTVDKYMGDAIMAFWNAPLDVPAHAELACTAALDMHQAVLSLNEELEALAKEEGRKHIPVNIGVGLNTDECCVGNMGSDQRFDYSALGDGVNLASRLEGQSKTYGVGTVIGHNTFLQVDGKFATVQLDLLQVKGKTEPVLIYGLLGNQEKAESEAFRKVRALNAEMIEAYRAREWDKAEQAAKNFAEIEPSLQVLRDLYLARIAEYRQTPPPENWDGSYIATSK